MDISRACAAATLALGCVLPMEAQAGSAPPAAPVKVYGNQTITHAGDVLRFALPAAAAGISLWKDDYQGLGQFALAYAGTVGIAYGLKHVIHERRPDGSDWQSMPSDSAASADAGAAYLWHRYGWQYGMPAEALALFVGYSRTQAKQHHWYDVAASAALSFGVNMLVVSRYHPRYDYDVSMGATPDGVTLKLSMNL
jgi:membrane-associated phospholipid phosphatase